jgi:hypothetical protein
MVRSTTRKLLRSGREDTLLFDLEADPLEMADLSADPGRQEEMRGLSDELARWALFDAPTPNHLDEYARICPAGNAQALADGHRQGTRR